MNIKKLVIGSMLIIGMMGFVGCENNEGINNLESTYEDNEEQADAYDNEDIEESEDTYDNTDIDTYENKDEDSEKNIDKAYDILEPVARENLSQADWEMDKTGKDSGAVILTLYIDGTKMANTPNPNWDELVEATKEITEKGEVLLSTYGINDVDYVVLVGYRSTDECLLVVKNGEVEEDKVNGVENY